MPIPTDYANLTGWWDASQESYANNDPVGTLTDRSTNTYDFTSSGTDRPVFKTSMFPLGGPGIDFDGTQQWMVSTNLQNLMSASAGTVMAVFKANSIESISAIWDRDAVFRSQGGSFGIHLDNVASVYGAQAYNQDVNEDINNHTISLDTPYVFAMRHSGGNLISSINGGSETSIASGDTGDIISVVELGRSAFTTFNFADITIAEVFVYSVARSAGEVAALATSLMEKWITPSGQPSSKRMGGVEHAMAGPNYPSRRW